MQLRPLATERCIMPMMTTKNTAIGCEALKGSITASNNDGTANTAIGYQSLSSNTSGYENTSVGSEALHSNTTGQHNNALGSGIPALETGHSILLRLKEEILQLDHWQCITLMITM